MELDDEFIGKTVILANKVRKNWFLRANADRTFQTIELDKLSPEERFRVRHEVMHEKHKGHESMHMEMVLVLLLSLVVCQFVLLIWRNYHIRSYQVKSLARMTHPCASTLDLLVFNHDRHVVDSIWFIDQILLYSFYSNLVLFYRSYHVRDTSSNPTASHTHNPKVKTRVRSLARTLNIFSL